MDAGHTTAEAKGKACWLAFTDGEPPCPVPILNCLNTPLDVALLSYCLAPHKQYPVLYDSRASQHMSSDKDRFLNFWAIDHQKFTIANSKSIDAIGMRD